MATMHPANINLSVAIIFFCRPDTLQQVFDKVKSARPSKLFLIQDGARKGSTTDQQKIEECRKIVEEIDWECDVLKNYSDVNLGCGRRPYTGISWVFENTNAAVIIEDDCVVEDSFFPFCKEMLDKYKDDDRVGMISSWNHLKKYDFGGNSYGFSKAAGCGAWATWASRWNKCDYALGGFNEYTKNCLAKDIMPSYVAKKKVKKWEKAKNEIESGVNVSYWDHQWNFTRCVNSWLTVTPKYNQMKNLGNTGGGTHFNSNLPKRIRNTFNMKTYNLEFPLVHPVGVVDDRTYDEKCFKILFPGTLELIRSKARQILFR